MISEGTTHRRYPGRTKLLLEALNLGSYDSVLLLRNEVNQSILEHDVVLSHHS